VNTHLREAYNYGVRKQKPSWCTDTTCWLTRRYEVDLIL